jgi:hypothetical protein
MPSIPKRVEERLFANIKRFQPILAAAKARDIGESDTVTIIKDMLADVYGYDKYADVTSEFAIRGTYCDLATKIDGKLQKLVEVKAIGLELKDQHVKQAVDYAANQGVEWVVLTNAVNWRIYRVTFGKPIENELVLEYDFLQINPKSDQHLDWLYLTCKEGWAKSVLDDFHVQKQALSRFFIGALLLSDSVVDVLRRELRKLAPDAKPTSEEIRAVLNAEVVKRDVVEGARRRRRSGGLRGWRRRRSVPRRRRADRVVHLRRWSH